MMIPATPFTLFRFLRDVDKKVRAWVTILKLYDLVHLHYYGDVPFAYEEEPEARFACMSLETMKANFLPADP